MSKVDDLPDGPMKDALREQETEFAEEMAGRWLDADAPTRADIEAFFESDGPQRVHEAKLKHEHGVPTSAELAEQLTQDVDEVRRVYFVKASMPPEKRLSMTLAALRAALDWLELGRDFDIVLENREAPRG